MPNDIISDQITVANFIGGKLIPPLSGEYIPNINPATNAVIAQVPKSSKKDVDTAVIAANEHLAEWKASSIKIRSNVLLQFAQVIEDHLEEFAHLETIDTGKPISLARRIDIPRAVENFRFFAKMIEEFGENFFYPLNSEKTGQNWVKYSPLGIVGTISPWNLPLYLLTWKIAPALAAGNAVIAKPSEITPLTAFRLSELASKTDLPPGILSIIHGEGADVGDSITKHPSITAISFTGSTSTGRLVASNCGNSLKKMSLEMGGKNASVIYPDCNIEKTVSGVLRAAFTNQGQVCLCGSKIFVHADIYQTFVTKLVAATKELKSGDPLSPETQQGAIVSKAQYQKVISYLKQAKKDGGTFLTGDWKIDLPHPCTEGYFIAPTLISDLPVDHPLNREEIFGPVATIISYNKSDDIVGMINDTEYGLSCSLWTEDLNQAKKDALNIDCGIVWINTWLTRDLRTPFGGMKSSGYGREGGRYALEFFSDVKTICWPS
ncbi:aldehyde dehydrogenase [Bacteriovoracaceae bacterium]|nr:aldehyde dehydrogenase [Bacteriovoracaceae bacterium]